MATTNPSLHLLNHFSCNCNWVICGFLFIFLAGEEKSTFMNPWPGSSRIQTQVESCTWPWVLALINMFGLVYMFFFPFNCWCFMSFFFLSFFFLAVFLSVFFGSYMILFFFLSLFAIVCCFLLRNLDNYTLPPLLLNSTFPLTTLHGQRMRIFYHDHFLTAHIIHTSYIL